MTKVKANTSDRNLPELFAFGGRFTANNSSYLWSGKQHKQYWKKFQFLLKRIDVQYQDLFAKGSKVFLCN